GLARGGGIAGQQVLVGGVEPQALAFAAAGGQGLGRVGAGRLGVPAVLGQAVGGGGGRRGGLGDAGLAGDLDAGAAGQQQGQEQGTQSRHGKSPWGEAAKIIAGAQGGRGHGGDAGGDAVRGGDADRQPGRPDRPGPRGAGGGGCHRSEEHTSELQSRENLVCRLLLEKKKE